MNRAYVFLLLSFFSLHLYSDNMVACRAQADQVKAACMSSNTNEFDDRNLEFDCQRKWKAAVQNCLVSNDSSNEQPGLNTNNSQGCNPRFEDCSSRSSGFETSNTDFGETGGNLGNGPGVDPNEVYNPTLGGAESGASSSSSAVSPSNSFFPTDSPSSDGGSSGGNARTQPNTSREQPHAVPVPRVPAPPPVHIPRIDYVYVNRQLNNCVNSRNHASNCCDTANHEKCLDQSSVLALTSAVSGYLSNSNAGMKQNCIDVGRAQEAIRTATQLSSEECGERRKSCGSSCESAGSRLTLLYNRECSPSPNHPECVSLSQNLSRIEAQFNSCDNMSPVSNKFITQIRGSDEVIKKAEECRVALHEDSTDGVVEGASKLADLALAAQSLKNPYPKGDSSSSFVPPLIPSDSNIPSLPSGLPNKKPVPSIAEKDDSPPGFDSKTGTVIPGYDELQEKQFLARLDDFEKNSKKLDSNLARGSSGSSSSGSGLLNSGGSGRDLDPLPGPLGVAPYKSPLFKEATSRKGWSSPAGKFNRGVSSQIDDSSDMNFDNIYRTMVSNESKPRKIHPSWLGLNLKDLFGSKHDPGFLELGEDQWIFGVNSQLHFSLFKYGEKGILSPQPLKRIKPHSHFPGLDYLRKMSQVSRKRVCTNPRKLRESFLNIKLKSRTLMSNIDFVDQWLTYNTNKDLDCFNRRSSPRTRNYNLVSKSSPFEIYKKGEYFDHSFLKMTIPNKMRADEKSPSWIFSGRLDEFFYTMLAKKVDPKIDTLKIFEMFLRNEIPYSMPGQITKFSTPIQIVTQKINGQMWVDGLHYESEAEGYYTRYVATVYKGKAILVSFNFKRPFLKKYIHTMNQVISTFVVNPNVTPPEYQDEKIHLALIKAKHNSYDIGKPELFKSEVKNAYSEIVKGKSTGQKLSFLFGLIFLLVGGGGYIFLNRERKRAPVIDWEIVKEKRQSQQNSKKKSS